MERRYDENGEVVNGFIQDNIKDLYDHPMKVSLWYKNGYLDRKNKPAHVAVTTKSDGKKTINKKWYKYGLLHRENGPAIEFSEGTKAWYKNGNREKLEHADGHVEYYKNNILHKKDGPAIIKKDGSTEWYKNGVLHREGGPAIELSDGTKAWYENGKIQEQSGPNYSYCEKYATLTLDHSYEIFKHDLEELITKYDSIHELNIYSSFLKKMFDTFTDVVYKKDEYLKYKTTNILVDHDQICSVDPIKKEE